MIPGITTMPSAAIAGTSLLVLAAAGWLAYRRFSRRDG